MSLKQILRHLDDYASEAILVLDHEAGGRAAARIVHANRVFETLTGFGAEEAVGQPPRFLGKDGAEKDQAAALRSAFESGRPATVPLAIHRKDGKIAPGSLTLVPADPAEGNGRLWVGVLRNGIEPAHDAAAAKGPYALAALGANDGLWDWDLKTGRVLYSSRWKAMLGFADDEIGGTPEEWLGRVHPADVEELRLVIDALVEGSSEPLEHEQRVRCRDGSYRWMLTRGVALRNGRGRAARIAGSQTDVSERRFAQQQVEFDAFHDGLTGLPNRALFLDRLGQAIALARRQPNLACAVLAVDIDRFKMINDSMGHGAGDEFLTVLARRLEGCLKEGDTLARIGGDEFAVLAERVADAARAITVAERIQQALAAPIVLDEQEIFTSVCVGIAMSSAGERGADDLMRDANLALYRAKSLGVARIEVFDQKLHARAVAKLKLETDLRRALDRDEIEVYYQPIVSLADGSVAGVEALARWLKSEHGAVPPAEFIPLAEETGLIVPLGRKVLSAACRKLVEWRRRYPAFADITLNVNVSAKQLSQTDIVGEIRDTLRATGLDGHHLKLEITESAIMENPDLAQKIFGLLREDNVRLSVDDFGTGYSSLSYLHRFPVDTLKIDRSFIGRLGMDSEEQTLVKSIIELGHGLGLVIVAEGVETKEQRDHLIGLACQFGQGYLFSPPLPADKIEALLADPPGW